MGGMEEEGEEGPHCRVVGQLPENTRLEFAIALCALDRNRPQRSSASEYAVAAAWATKREVLPKCDKSIHTNAAMAKVRLPSLPP